MTRREALKALKDKMNSLKAAGGYGGDRYLKSGDYVGEMCPNCGQDMMINKSGKWSLYCHCGYTKIFKHRDPDFDPHWSEADYEETWKWRR